jgi:hypothetical protein
MWLRIMALLVYQTLGGKKKGILLVYRLLSPCYDTNLLDSQKLIFLDTSAGVSTTLRPYWSEATRDRATVVQAVPDMLEIVPLGTSKGSGVKMLLDHLGSTAKEVWAIIFVIQSCEISILHYILTIKMIGLEGVFNPLL